MEIFFDTGQDSGGNAYQNANEQDFRETLNYLHGQHNNTGQELNQSYPNLHAEFNNT